MEKKLSKDEFIIFFIENIRKDNKLTVLKGMVELSRNPKDYYKNIGLKEGKDFLDEHMSDTEENAEIVWKFCKGKLK